MGLKVSDRDFLYALYNACNSSERVADEIREVLSRLPDVVSSSSLDIDFEPIWPSWRHDA